MLKYLSFIKKVQIIVINSSNGLWMNEGVKIVNKYIGLPWEYMISRRYLINKHNEYGKLERNITLIERNDTNNGSDIDDSTQIEDSKFIITDSGIEIIKDTAKDTANDAAKDTAKNTAKDSDISYFNS